MATHRPKDPSAGTRVGHVARSDADTLVDYSPATGVARPTSRRSIGPPGPPSGRASIGAQTEPATPIALPTAAPGRYAEGTEIGRGGMGLVRTARDALFGREVAIKQLLVPDDPGLMARFLDEARVTAQLEHPNVVPVHDMGVLPTGDVFFAMKVVRGHSLADILDGLEEGDAAVVAEFSRVRLLTLFQQVCMGVHYAHSRGVVHRDLKPDNIMVGTYGEVHVMDWGVAKVLGGPPDPELDARTPTISPTQQGMTAVGAVVGTPEYMPPEQAQGRHDLVGTWSDVYALGAILYEVLTGAPPFRERTPLATLMKVFTEPPLPPRKRAPERGIPEELDELCLRALSKAPDERPASARALFDAIEHFLEGTRERERRRHQADRLAAEGRGALDAAGRADAEIETLRRQEADLEASTAPHAPVEEKRAIWATRDRVHALETTRDQRVAEAVRAYSEAVRNDPEHTEGRRALADYYWARLEEAEDRRDRTAALHFRRMVLMHNDGAYDALLRGDAPLAVTSDPSGARVLLHALAPVDRVLAPGPPRDLGATPCEPVEVPRGSYLLVLEAGDGGRVVRPVRVGREAWVDVHVRLLPQGVIGEGFVHVPAGPAILGGDHLAPGATRRRVVDLPDFAIAVQPVSCGDYVRFLNALIDAGHDAEARFRAPREWAGGGHYWAPSERDGRFSIPITDRDGHEWQLDWPVGGVSWKDAMRYCAWWTETTGVAVRLPSADEWEKAARGVDGRLFPWGDEFDPLFCLMRLSHPGPRTPGLIGAFATDRSPYGAWDMAGGMRDWTSTSTEEGLRVTKGGAWNLQEELCRPATVYERGEGFAATSTGFRLARDLPSGA